MKSLSPTSSPEPKYVWFADFVRRQIQMGELKPGDRLPSRSEIHEQHRIAQPTIERAQAILEQEGLIVRRGRQGVFVAENPGDTAAVSGSNGASRVMTSVIAVVTPHGRQVHPDHHQLGWSDFITQGALSACTEWGKHALIIHPERLRGGELEHLLENPPLGFVFSGLTKRENIEELRWLLNALRQKSQRVAVFGDELEFDEFDRVDSAHETGGYLLTRHLIQQGHKRILPFYPAMDDGMHWLAQRHQGYLRAMYEAGLQPLPIREYPDGDRGPGPDDTIGKFERTARYRAGFLVDYLGRERRCDAILSISDGDVFAHAASCRLLGYEPNRDVALAGYDNIWRDAVERTFLDVQPVATVDKHNWRLGRELVQLLMARISGQLPPASQYRLVEPELIVPGDLASADFSMAAEQLDPVFKTVVGV